MTLAAEGTTFHDWNVAYEPSVPVVPSDDRVVYHKPAPHTLADRQYTEAVTVPAGPKPVLGSGQRPDVVREYDRPSGATSDDTGERHLRPTQVR